MGRVVDESKQHTVRALTRDLTSLVERVGSLASDVDVLEARTRALIGSGHAAAGQLSGSLTRSGACLTDAQGAILRATGEVTRVSILRLEPDDGA